MHLKIEKPAHGWLPVSVDLGDYELSATASDVANDPIGELLDVLRLSPPGKEGETRVLFWEEPSGWALDFRFETTSEWCQVRVLHSWNWFSHNMKKPQRKHETKVDRRSVGKAIATCINAMLRTVPDEILTEWNSEQTYAQDFSGIQRA